MGTGLTEAEIDMLDAWARSTPSPMTCLLTHAIVELRDYRERIKQIRIRANDCFSMCCPDREFGFKLQFHKIAKLAEGAKEGEVKP